MSKMMIKQFVQAICAFALALLLVAPAAALQKTPRPKSDKPADSTKIAAPAKPLTAPVKKPAESPKKADSTKAKKPTPAKLNDFQDANKNGIDDRIESKSSAKKPIPTATKSKPPAKPDSTKSNQPTTITKTKKSK